MSAVLTLPGPVVSVDWLRAHIDAPELRIADVRWSLSGPPGAERYADGHLPGAVFLDSETELSSPGEGPGRHPVPTADKPLPPAALRERYDVILVDTPPFLAVAEAMALSETVDGVVAVAHLGTQRPMLRELARELQQCRARTLGYILTGVTEGDRHAYGYGYGYGYTEEREPKQKSRKKQRKANTQS